MEDNNNKPMSVMEFADTMIGLGLAAVLIILCIQVFAPFIGIMLWAVVLAMTLYPAHQAPQDKFSLTGAFSQDTRLMAFPL